MEFKWWEYISDTVIINLEERVDRKEILDHRLERVMLGDGKNLKDYSRYFSAIDTTKVNNFRGVYEKYYDFDYHYVVDKQIKLKSFYGKGLVVESTNTEMGIACSHYSIWKNIVDNKVPVTFIIEDDVIFKYGFLDNMSKILMNEIPKDFDLLYMSYDITNSTMSYNFSENLSKIEMGLWWLSAYVLTYEGAKKLIESLPIIGPVDVWINHQFKNLNVYAINEPIIVQSYETKSSNEGSFPNYYKHLIG